MNEVFEYKEYSKVYKNIFILIGVFTWALFYNYSYFFERELYLNRKRLLEYIKRNPLPPPSREGIICYEWVLNSDSKTPLFLFYWEDKQFSLHKKDKVLLSNFHDGFSDNKVYNELKTILEVNIKQFKEQNVN